MCFDPKRDGALLWPSIHILAANADNSEKRAAYVAFVRSLTVMYPCAKCRKHTKTFLEEFAVENYAGSAQDLLYWSWIYHDSVNRKLHKPTEQTLTWDQVREKYMANCEEPKATAKNGNRNNSSQNRSDSNGECIDCSTDDEEEENESNEMDSYRSITRRQYKPIN